MKKIFLMLILVCLACCFFALGISAASTNEFGTVETSNTIDLTNMSTDTKTRVVLFDGVEYHTYPSQYIVTNAGDLTMKFDYINAAFNKQYVVSSVIRIEIPNTVKVLTGGWFNYGKNDNIKEVYFPKDSTVYKFNWGCFENNKSLEKVNIPASVTEYNGTNHFCNCASLKYVTFDEGYSCSYLPNNFFQKCKSLETLVLPNSLVSIGGGLVSECGNIKSIVFGSSLQTMAGPVSDCSTGPSVWYLPSSFYASYVESEPASNMIHWDGNNNKGGTTSGNHNNPKNITFVFTGTKEEAEALQARCRAADASVGENCIGLKRIWDAVLCTEAEFEELTGKKIGEGATGYYLVYDYSPCRAFYDGDHAMAGKELATVNSYFESITIGDKCIRDGCGEAVVTKTIGAIFTYHGYSYSEYVSNGTYLVAQFFSINNENLIEYKNFTNKSFSFGLVASSVANPLAEENSGYIGTRTFLKADIPATDYFGIKISGITDSTVSAKLIVCAYVIDGESVVYLDNGKTVKEIEGKSFEQIKEFFAATPIK